jgi:lysophospholipase L1-like esterase
LTARSQSPIKSILFTVVAAGLAIVVLEVGARALRAALGWAPQAGLSVPHPTLLWRMRPNFTGVAHETPIRTNSLGLRGPEPRPTPGSGRPRLRLLVIGDSVGFGFGVEEEESWPRLLERRLGAAWDSAGLDVEVVNGAVIGYGTFQEAAALREIGPRLRPDVVLWQLSSNDIVENYFYAPRSPIRLLLDRSGLFNLLRDAWLRARGSRTYEEVEGEPGRRRGRGRRKVAEREFGVIKEDAVFAQDKPEVLAKAWSRTDEAAAGIERAAKEIGAELLCVVFPAGTQVYGANRSTVLQDSVASVCARHGVPVIDLLDRFRGRRETYKVTHPTREGNELAADATGERLAPLIARLAEGRGAPAP